MLLDDSDWFVSSYPVVEVEANGSSDVEWINIRVEVEKLSCDVRIFAVTLVWEVFDILWQNMELFNKLWQPVKKQFFVPQIWQSWNVPLSSSCIWYP